MPFSVALGILHLPLAYVVLNIDPIFFQIGPIAVHWYGLMYVLAISIGLAVLLRWTRAQGVSDDQAWGLFIWTAIAGLIGGRLYFVIQQPHLVENYLLRPANIIAVWNGGMAFFGAIFLGSATLFLLAPRYGLSRFLAIDGGALFAAVGQIFGRFGNIINGDILGNAASNGPVSLPGDTCAHAPCLAFVPDQHILSWALVYLNPHSFAPQGIAYQPAPVYEILLNLVMLALLYPLRLSLPRLRAGYFFVLYLALYAVSQLIVFFYRGTEPITPFLGITVFKQAQWTAIIVLLLCVPLFILIRRYAQPWEYSEKHPTPWLPAGAPQSGGQGAPRAVPVAAVAGSAGTLAAAPRVTGPAPAPTTSAPPAPADLPQWQPTHATNGRLRNLFGG